MEQEGELADIDAKIGEAVDVVVGGVGNFGGGDCGLEHHWAGKRIENLGAEGTDGGEADEIPRRNSPCAGDDDFRERRGGYAQQRNGSDGKGFFHDHFLPVSM